MSVIIIVIIIFNGLVRCELRNECYYDYLFYFQVCQGVHYVMSVIIIVIIFNGLVRCALRNERYDYLFYFQVCQCVHYVRSVHYVVSINITYWKQVKVSFQCKWRIHRRA